MQDKGKKQKWTETQARADKGVSEKGTITVLALHHSSIAVHQGATRNGKKGTRKRNETGRKATGQRGRSKTSSLDVHLPGNASNPRGIHARFGLSKYVFLIRQISHRKPKPVNN